MCPHRAYVNASLCPYRASKHTKMRPKSNAWARLSFQSIYKVVLSENFHERESRFVLAVFAFRCYVGGWRPVLHPAPTRTVNLLETAAFRYTYNGPRVQRLCELALYPWP